MSIRIFLLSKWKHRIFKISILRKNLVKTSTEYVAFKSYKICISWKHKSNSIIFWADNKSLEFRVLVDEEYRCNLLVTECVAAPKSQPERFSAGRVTTGWAVAKRAKTERGGRRGRDYNTQSITRGSALTSAPFPFGYFPQQQQE